MTVGHGASADCAVCGTATRNIVCLESLAGPMRVPLCDEHLSVEHALWPKKMYRQAA